MREPTSEHISAIETLLADSGLPTDDLNHQDLSLFRIEVSSDGLDAVGGLERCDNSALLRSVATKQSMRGSGLAGNIIRKLEQLAATEGFDNLYLLTESAQSYFESKGYITVERSDVPVSIRKSQQFSSLCPDTAVVMFKRVGV